MWRPGTCHGRFHVENLLGTDGQSMRYSIVSNGNGYKRLCPEAQRPLFESRYDSWNWCFVIHLYSAWKIGCTRRLGIGMETNHWMQSLQFLCVDHYTRLRKDDCILFWKRSRHKHTQRHTCSQTYTLYAPIHLSVRPSVRQPIHPPIHPSIHPSIHPCTIYPLYWITLDYIYDTIRLDWGISIVCHYLCLPEYHLHLRYLSPPWLFNRNACNLNRCL